MGWDVRGPRRYYSRSRKINRKVVRQYVGGGSLGELAAAADALRRAERMARAEALHAEEQCHTAATAPLGRLCQLADLLMKAVLVSEGYHQHSRGQWRRRRHAPGNRDATPRREDLPGGAEDTA